MANTPDSAATHEGQTTTAARWQVHCDGTAHPNPGRMSIGVVVTAPDGVQHSLSRALGASGCNNEAEARALIAALQLLHDLGAEQRPLQIHSDSSVLVAQLAGATPVARLAHVFDEARVLLAGFGDARLVWVPRHRNRMADTLARAALDLADKSDLKPRPKKRQARRR
ncbi:ribonuclease HI family protein [Uliginosibacterium sp. H3]|uniref:Ribonuclease HI family protein n=1 Tax=Uliginosibacterium silvisoli TaxID=3114758 RepID=A0ABU6JYQ2_9RHOO|nr:ribonuclease HI family protein [Uliginosibacterium sp. H3]